MNGWIEIAYLAAASLFIVGLKNLSSPKTAPRGNLLAAVGMFIAVLATLLDKEIVDFGWIAAGIVIGGACGIFIAQKVAMTAMPQLVAILNGLGGAASTFVAWSELTKYWADARDTATSAAAEVANAAAGSTELTTYVAVPMVLSTLIGSLTFTGSLIAFGKLQEVITGRAVTYPMQKPVNLILLIGLLVCSVQMAREPMSAGYFSAILVLASVLGVLSVMPIGGADMPVVISLLNSYSGLAASATGFVLQNNALIISGSLVGASGIILTQIMCKAMNRSLANVLFGAFGGGEGGGGDAGPGAGSTGTVKSGSAEEAAMLLEASSLVVVVPGYGLAVAQAQHVVRELADLLGAKGIDVKYAIHPVAGRMPGHMNVLLAEADVPYDQLCDMDQINPEFPQADVALVIGANDVTNPAARSDPSSPIYGMPILDVDKARTVMVLKRSMKPGFAGIDNPLYTEDKTMMVFGDAKATVTAMVQALKEL